MRARAQRGVALVQALVIVAAIAAVAAALMLRTETARQRLQTRFDADQGALYLDSGVAMVAAQITALPAETAVHLGQDWAQERSGIVIDRGVLAWQVDDLQARFNVNSLTGLEPAHDAARAAFLRLAAEFGLRRETARRLADILGADPAAREAAMGDTPLFLPLIDPRQMAPFVGIEATRWAEFVRMLSALPDATLLNINTVDPLVLKALAPDLPSAALSALARRVQRAPFASLDALYLWADEALSPEISAQFGALGLTVTSDWFLARFEARLDTLSMRRSVVLYRDEAQGRSVVTLSIPEFED